MTAGGAVRWGLGALVRLAELACMPRGSSPPDWAARGRRVRLPQRRIVLRGHGILVVSGT
jgi:hypothetical protein